MATVESRVGRLESQAGGGGGGDGDDCNHCGWPHDEDGDDDIPYEIVFTEDDEEVSCPQCGRVFLTIYFDDDPRAPWNVQ